VTVETLRPNAAGTYTELQYQYPDSGAHWDKVDEETADDDSTYVRCIDYMDGIQRDTYNLPSSSIPVGSVINKITVKKRVRSDFPRGVAPLSLSDALIITHGTLYVGTGRRPPDTYTNYADEWVNNPFTGAAWTIDEINALEIGDREGWGYNPVMDIFNACRMTQIYVEIDYTPPVAKPLINKPLVNPILINIPAVRLLSLSDFDLLRNLSRLTSSFSRHNLATRLRSCQVIKQLSMECRLFSFVNHDGKLISIL